MTQTSVRSTGILNSKVYFVNRFLRSDSDKNVPFFLNFFNLGLLLTDQNNVISLLNIKSISLLLLLIKADNSEEK